MADVRKSKALGRELSGSERAALSTLWRWMLRAQQMGLPTDKSVDGAVICARYEISGRRYKQKGVMA